MKGVMRTLAILIAIVIIGAAGFIACARLGLLTPSDSELMAKYSLPGSKFMDLDGEPIHYMDEGSGEAIVLIHGSFSSLLAWNDWAAALKSHYRVIRFDHPPLGLSGPDPMNRYTVDRDIEIIDELTAKLGIDRFFLVSTSSGGLTGAAYAAARPERMKGVVLSNIAVGPVKIDRSHYPESFKLALMVDPWLKNWHPQALWRGVFTTTYADPSKVTPALITEWTDLNNRAINIEASHQVRAGGASLFDRTLTDLTKITAPTLLLWSAEDHEIPVKPAGETALGLLAAQDKTLLTVPNCGHLMAIECGPESVAVAQAFFDRVSASSP